MADELPAGPPRDDTTEIRVFAFLYYVAGFFLGVGLEALFPTDWPSDSLRLVATLVATVAWLALDVWAIALFGAAGTSIWPFEASTALVTDGPYRLTRNPQYVGIAFFYLAFAFGFGVTWALAVLPAVLVLVDRLIVAREEPYLERRFGAAYLEYKARVRRWL